MSTKRRKEPRTVISRNAADLPGNLKPIGGSMSDDWNTILANQTVQALWTGHADEPTLSLQLDATVAALIGIGPKDELEGMIAAQLIASHNAAMECYRRAMMKDQTLEGWRETLNQANKLSRTHGALLESLNRYRGKGQQKVTVEHVHVHSGGQAVVGVVTAPGGGHLTESEDQPHAKQIDHAPQSSMWGSDAKGKQMPVAGDDERPLPDARG